MFVAKIKSQKLFTGLCLLTALFFGHVYFLSGCSKQGAEAADSGVLGGGDATGSNQEKPTSEPDVAFSADNDATIQDDVPEYLGPDAGPMQISGTFTLLELPIPEGEFPVFGGKGTEFPDITTGTFGDLDQDGLPELVIGFLECCNPAKRARVFKYDPETQSLVVAPDLLEFPPYHEMGMLSALVDLNDDGIMDVVLSRYKKIYEEASLEPLYKTPLYFGNETGVWSPSGPVMTPDDADQVFFGGTIDLVDLDYDGWLDVLLSDEHCPEESGTSVHPILRVGPSTFQHKKHLIEETPHSIANALFARPLGPSSMLVFSAGHNCLDANPMDGFFEPTEFDSEGYPLFTSFDPTPLESSYKAEAVVSYGPITKASPMGSVLTDFNHDGLVDFGVSLFWEYAIFQGTNSWPMRDRTAENGLVLHPGIGGENLMIPWGMAPIDVDLDGFPDLIVNHGDDYTAWVKEENFVGLHYTTTFRNLGGFAFEDITEETGLAVWGNWRAMSVGDINRDGKADLIVGGVGYLPQVWLNTIETPHHGFAVQLKGHTSNSLGIGAKVAVMTSATPPQLQLMGNISSPHVVSEPLVFFGTATAETVDTLRITWPSGYVQELYDLPSDGVHVVEEPPLVTLDPVSRHLPADGESTFVIQVRPHDIQGLPMDGVVEVETVFGEAAFAGPVVNVGENVWERVLVAPSTSGSSVIEVSVDGVPLTVRPRVWWD